MTNTDLEKGLAFSIVRVISEDVVLGYHTMTVSRNTPFLTSNAIFDLRDFTFQPNFPSLLSFLIPILIQISLTD